MLVLLSLFVVILSAILSGFYLFYDIKRLSLPGPLPLPLVGNAFHFIGDSAHFIKKINELSELYGPKFRAHLFNQPYVLLSHPKLIEGIMSSMDLIVKGRSYRYLRAWLGDGLLTASGYRWKSHRRFLTPAFHFNILQNFLPVFCKNGTILCDKIARMTDGRQVRLFPIIALAALDNITESIMGVSLDAQKDSESEYVKSIEDLTQIISIKMRNPFIAEDFIFNWTSLKKKQDKALKVLHGQTTKVIEARREDLKRNNINSLPDNSDIGIKNKHAFLDLLLLAEVDGKKISNEHIREEVDTFMFEGHDTTTSGIVYCLYCLSKHEDVQEKVFREQKEILGDDYLQRDPSYTDLSKMKYLELVIKESLRLYPSVPFIERLVMQDTETDGMFLPKGTSVIVNILGMQRNPDVYKDPLKFKPERFESNDQRHAFSWIPFSAGPRNCIGQKFAMMELKATLSAIVKRFIILPTGEEPELCADLILRSKNGVHVKFLPRIPDLMDC